MRHESIGFSECQTGSFQFIVNAESFLKTEEVRMSPKFCSALLANNAISLILVASLDFVEIPLREDSGFLDSLTVSHGGHFKPLKVRYPRL